MKLKPLKSQTDSQSRGDQYDSPLLSSHLIVLVSSTHFPISRHLLLSAPLYHLFSSSLNYCSLFFKLFHPSLPPSFCSPLFHTSHLLYKQYKKVYCILYNDVNANLRRHIIFYYLCSTVFNSPSLKASVQVMNTSAHLKTRQQMLSEMCVYIVCPCQDGF